MLTMVPNSLSVRFKRRVLLKLVGGGDYFIIAGGAKVKALGDYALKALLRAVALLVLYGSGKGVGGFLGAGLVNVYGDHLILAHPGYRNGIPGSAVHGGGASI